MLSVTDPAMELTLFYDIRQIKMMHYKHFFVFSMS